MSLILVAGAIANRPFKGGEAWHRLSWVFGLKRLGFDVHLIEHIDASACRNRRGEVVPFEASENLAYFTDVTRAFGLENDATLVYGEGERAQGRAFAELGELADAAALLVNISGHLRLESLLRRIRRRVFIDEDPGFTQHWHAAGVPDLNIAGHDAYFSVGENIGASDCTIPTGDITWRRTRPFTVLDDWPVTPPLAGEPRFTTVASWRGPFGVIEVADGTLGLKVHEFRSLIDLPVRTGAALELALDIHPDDAKDRASLAKNGWRVVDPREVAGTPKGYRRYIQGSAAEFSVAKGVYVATASGWFSDRSVRYLASGKPVLLQDTGFSRNYPVGEGLLTFRTLDEAVAGIEAVGADYERHSRAARSLAETHFDSDIVLAKLLSEAGV